MNSTVRDKEILRERLAERDRRWTRPRDVIRELLGDPEPGRSTADGWQQLGETLGSYRIEGPLQHALEAGGVDFIPESRGEPGVRLRNPATSGSKPANTS